MPSSDSRRLDSWKTIAAYLGRSVRTAVRWADERGLPVHHVPGGKRHAVFAYSDEIDSWLLSKSNTLDVDPAAIIDEPSPAQQPSPLEPPQRVTEEPHPPTNTPETIAVVESPQVPPYFAAQIPKSHLRRSNTTTWIVASASFLVCLAASILIFSFRSSHAGASANSRKLRIAVLPVQDLTGDNPDGIFADALSEELVAHLGQLNPSMMQVISQTSSMTYKGSNKTVPQIARELGVDYLLESSIQGSPDQFKLRTQLIRTRDQSSLWTQDYDRTSTNVAQLEYELSRDVASQIGLRAPPGTSAREVRSLSIHSDSHLDYLQGRYLWNQRNKEGFERGFEYFKRAAAEDPQNARAYSGMADAYNMLIFYGYSGNAGSIAKAGESAHHAVQLDPSLAEGHASLGYVDFMWTWEWPSAENEFRRAIELDANYVPAHHWYALYLASMGRHAEADREIRTALNLDPFSSAVQSAAAYVHYFARDYDRSIQECQAVLQRNPDSLAAHSVLGLGYEGIGQYPQAISEFRKLDELTGGHLPYYKGLLGHAYAVAGNTQGARKTLGDLNAMAIQGTYASQTAKATIYTGLREKANALDALDRASDQNDASLIWLGVDPRFDPLRAEPRFQQMLKAQGR